MRACTFHKAVRKEPVFPVSDHTVRMHSKVLLIIFAVSLFFFLSYKVAILLEIQVDLLADSIFPIRKVNKAVDPSILCVYGCRCASEVVKSITVQKSFGKYGKGAYPISNHS